MADVFRHASRIDGFFSKKSKKTKKNEKKGLHFSKSRDILSNVPSEQVNTTRGISTVGRTKFSDVRPTLKAVNGESAQNSSGIFGALAQLVARYIRIVEVSGSNPLCSTTRKTLDSIRILGSFFIFLYNRFPGVDSRFDSNQLLSRVLMGQKARCFFCV